MMRAAFFFAAMLLTAAFAAAGTAAELRWNFSQRARQASSMKTGERPLSWALQNLRPARERSVRARQSRPEAIQAAYLALRRWGENPRRPGLRRAAHLQPRLTVGAEAIIFIAARRRKMSRRTALGRVANSSKSASGMENRVEG